MELPPCQEKSEENPSKRIKTEEPKAFLTSEKLAKFLECPICCEIPVDVYIYSCTKGHHVCGTCRRKLNKCPQCRAQINGTRSFGLEEIIQASSLKCKNYGCNSILQGLLMKDHMQACEFRPVRCFDPPCIGNLIALCDFLNHLISEHDIKETKAQANGYFTEPFNYNLFDEDAIWSKGFVSFDGKTFVINGTIEANIFYFWLSFLGTELQAKEYKYSAMIERKNGEKDEQIQLKITDVPVHSHQNELNGIQTFGDYFSFGVKTFEKFSVHSLDPYYQFQVNFTCKLDKIEKNSNL